MSTTPRRLAQGLLLLLLPALTFAAAEHGRGARGPFYFGANQDPAYSYLLGSLQTGTFGETGFFHHPGLTTQAIGAGVLAATHIAFGRHEQLAWDALARPEGYLRALQLATLAAVCAVLAACGFVVWRGGDPVAALLLQSAPLLGAAGLESLSQVGPESTLMLAAVALCLAIWRFAAAPPADERLYAVVFGALVAFALTTRVSALAFALAPLLLLRTWRGRFLYGAATGAAAGLTVFLLVEQRWKLLATVLFHSRRTGSYGAQQKSLADPSVYAEGVAVLFLRHYSLFVVMTLGAAVWLWAWRRRPGSAAGLYHRALGAVLLGQTAQVLIVSKTPAGRYLVPATALTALTLALVWALIAAGQERRRHRAIVAALLLVFPAALELPRHRAELQRMRQGVAGQRVIAEEIAKLPEGCTVAEFFRASSIPYALHFGGRLSPVEASFILAKLYPGEIFYNHFGRYYEDFITQIPPAEVGEKHPCLVLHGYYLPDLESRVIRKTPIEVLYSVPSVDAVVAPAAAE